MIKTYDLVIKNEVPLACKVRRNCKLTRKPQALKIKFLLSYRLKIRNNYTS